MMINQNFLRGRDDLVMLALNVICGLNGSGLLFYGCLFAMPDDEVAGDNILGKMLQTGGI